MALLDPQNLAALVTLTVLEIVLGIDNLVFIAVSAARLPKARQAAARRVGLALALFTRLALLAAIAWMAQLTVPIFELLGQSVSWRDLVLFAGGLFLLYKGTFEIHESVEDVTALGDRDAIKQILLVLLDNALKHTSGPVSLNAAAADGHVELSVQDSGPGISPEQLEHIYDRFNRGEADPSIPGFGLGLPIAKALAEAQGGSIQIESEVGSGSKVTISLLKFTPE